MGKKMLINTNDDGRVVARIYKPDRLSKAKKEGFIEVDEDDIPPRPEDELDIDRAELMYDADSGKFEWIMRKGTPEEVAKYKLKIALKREELLDKVEDELENMDEEARIAWEDASVIRRESATVAALAEALDLHGNTVNALFRTAYKLEF